MPRIVFTLSLLTLLASTLGWAAPAQLENNDYKVAISETLPGIDAGGAILAPGAGITVTVTDKFRSQQSRMVLTGYAIPNYFLLGDTLNLILRTTPLNTPTGPRYSFLQVELGGGLSNQFAGLRQYSFSPDQQNLLAVVDNGPGPVEVGVASLADNAAEDSLEMRWLYAEPARVNQFKSAFSGPVTALTVNDPVGWSADSLSAAFLFTVDDGTRDAQENPVLKDYLASLVLGDKGWMASAQPVDLSSYHFHSGAALTDLRSDGRKARLFFTSDKSTSPVEADFSLSPR